MPLMKIADKHVYFAHVPRCAGSSTEAYLESRFGELRMLDRDFWANRDRNWWRSSPQHVDRYSLAKLVGEDFFDHIFTIVRHPTDRYLSAFRHNQLRGTVSPLETPVGLLRKIGRFSEHAHFSTDNHFRPMSDIAPQSSRVFRLEDGFDPVVAWLDTIEGQSSAASVDTHNSFEQISARATSARSRVVLGLRALRKEPDRDRIDTLVRDVFAVDFDRFDY